MRNFYALSALAIFLALPLGAFLPRPSEGTLQMAELLQKIKTRTVDSGRNPFFPRARIDLMQQNRPPQDLRQLLPFKLQLAQTLLYAGDTTAAIDRFNETIQLVRQNLDRLDERTITNLRELLGVAYLRQAEQQNCIAHHGIDSCLLPIQGDGVHQLKEGGEAAMREFLAVLKKEPENLTAIWLLNLSAMTVGRYPDAVPVRWRIPPERFQSDYAVPRFRDVAPAAGVDVLGLSGGSITEDFDGDGYLDVVASSWGLSDQLRFFRNRQDGTFEDRTIAAGLQGITGGLNLTHADYNNDGYPDILVLRGAWQGELGRQPNSLLRNNGDGTFSDVTVEAGLFSLYPTQTADWADFDLDGDLDLFIGNESYQSEHHPSEFYRNNGDGTFSNIASQIGMDVTGYVKAVKWGDFNNDGRPDLFVSRLLEPNLLFENRGRLSGKWTFSEVAGEAGVQEPLHSFPAWFFDYDNDGWLDLFVTGYEIDYLNVTVAAIAAEYLGEPVNAQKPRLYRNNGDGTFSDVTKKAGLDRVLYAMGCNFGDLDNDGWLDFYLGTGAPDYRVLIPNLMFRNAGGQRFQDVTTSGGFGHLQKGHGVSFADLDNDGDQDLYTTMGGAYSGDVYQNILFENPGTEHNWTTLRLVGSRSNRSAIGARLRLILETPEGLRTIYRWTGTGGSFGSSSLQQEIGLGNAEGIQELEIQWPGGKVDQFQDLPVNSILRITEGSSESERIDLKSLKFPK